jgi:hypothetical protein
MISPGSSGEVYRRIRLAHHHEDWDWKKQWQSTIQPAYLQIDIERLQEGREHEPLRDALDQLLGFPGLWMDLQLTFFHNLGAPSYMEVSAPFPKQSANYSQDFSRWSHICTR